MIIFTVAQSIACGWALPMNATLTDTASLKMFHCLFNVDFVVFVVCKVIVVVHVFSFSVLTCAQRMNKSKIDGREVFVDFEHERTLKGWIPRRLGIYIFGLFMN